MSLPSPVLAMLALVFVVLPVVWPETDDAGPGPAAQADFNLAADVTSVAVSPDACRVAATGRDRPITIWQQGRGEEWGERLLPEHRPTGSRCLAAAADGRTLAAGNVDGTVSLWDMTTGESLASLAGGNEMVLAVSFSADSRLVAAAGGDAHVRIWDVATARQVATIDVPEEPITSLAFAPDGRAVACGCEDGAVRIWDVGRPGAAPQVFIASQEVILAVAFSPDGRTMASASLCGHGVHVWNVPDRRDRGLLRTKGFTATCLGFTPDGNHLLVGEEEGTLSAWNVFTLAQVGEFTAHTGWVKSLAVAQGSPSVVTGGNDGLVRRWDIAEILAGRPRR
jgi:WD40 repeat protein